jgi:hypothetical protein
MSARQRVKRNLSEAAETCDMTSEIARRAYFSVEFLHILHMQGRKDLIDVTTRFGVILGRLDIVYHMFELQHPVAQIVVVVK